MARIFRKTKIRKYFRYTLSCGCWLETFLNKKQGEFIKCPQHQQTKPQP